MTTQASVWVDEGGGDLSHTEPDGTRWTICPVEPGVYALTMRYRDHRLVSRHADADAAKRHYADMVAMFAARNLDAYAVARITDLTVDPSAEGMF